MIKELDIYHVSQRDKEMSILKKGQEAWRKGVEDHNTSNKCENEHLKL